ncbi:MAG TPA: DUF3551 domain-containing protein [Bradyrhizobium sp.]|nr:DUF3551 domain-containing protein [Bradyrhizobium sp.]
MRADELQRDLRVEEIFLRGISDLQNATTEEKEKKMTPASKKLTASAATLFTFAFVAMTAPAAYADDYCITNGAQVAHGCGYPTMEACRAASAGIGGSCSEAPSGSGSTASNPSSAMAYQPRHPHARIKHHRVR